MIECEGGYVDGVSIDGFHVPTVPAQECTSKIKHNYSKQIDRIMLTDTA